MTAGLRLEARLVSSFLRNAGWPRAVVVAACTAVVSGLLLVAIAVLRFGPAERPTGLPMSNLVSDAGVRGGYVFALLLLCVMPLVLLQQVVRLGTASREQRLAALRLAGATPAEVRRLSGIEIGVPALIGGVLGYLVYRALAAGLNGVADPGSGWVRQDVARELRLIPTTVGPTWWHVALVALAVGVLGLVAGLSTSRSLTLTPLGVSRRAPRSAPRPWAALALLALAVALLAAGFSVAADDSYALASFACVVAGVLALSPWVAYVAARAASANARHVPLLLAARRLATDARPAGRSAAAVGVISMVASGCGHLLPDLLGTRGPGDVEAMYAVPVVLVAIVLLVALVLVVFAMAIHGVETLLDRSRSTASLAALGMSTDELTAVQRWEVGLVALPMAVIGVLIGTLPFGHLVGDTDRLWVSAAVSVGTIALVWLAVLASTLVTRPWLHRAMSSENLRTA